MTPRVLHHAANDTRFHPFPLARPTPRLTLIQHAPAATMPFAHLAPFADFEFMLADSEADLTAAAALVEQCYGWRGYPAQRPESTTGETTLLVRRAGRLVGTVTVRCGVTQRLHAESGFAEHVGALREQGCRLIEYTRFAIDREVLTRTGQEIDLAFELIRRALRLGQVSLAATDAVIEVNPRHVRYYQRAFGFRAFGAERRCERVGAPARLLHLNLSALDPAKWPVLALH
ncbi:hypothetical protein [Methyloversatilis sp.]|uniref:N-acyl amino acid synthase FeeM domain-containing protein n=1 Tax=Methyloversatilis sp. TaxID=2569862 RepID=UPI0027373CCB|nr:hypothetical protein [Methyloversatilis sp.]MDP2870012.1 hypothetical protein [Methyloversatilis sp.]MDP3287460.1 hypothetical protein [Methyloversatilis sp.]MDP3455394.1 hypothetical protein [Methyloversatilis sp.]MDP3578539.1 hypothetical protein [Methyloversatilis sp.]